MLIMSVGVFSDTIFLNDVKKLAIKKNCKVYLPSGAICGLDGVKSASVEGIESVEITSIKNPRSLEGQPHLIENNINIDGLTAPKIVFEGNAKDAVKGFPKSVNVAVGLSLAGIGVEKTRVTVIADPNATRTKHEIKVVGDFGELHTSVNNLLHPSNPRTSYLAALSGIRTLRKITEPIQIGT
jgi:aspartate dehydrogenase